MWVTACSQSNVAIIVIDTAFSAACACRLNCQLSYLLIYWLIYRVQLN